MERALRPVRAARACAVSAFEAGYQRLGLQRWLPPYAAMPIFFLLVANALVWAAVIVVAVSTRRTDLLASVVLSYSFGLRHALDADHITAIDNLTRRLIAEGQVPTLVGTLFSMGHSTVVCVTCVVIAATSAAIAKRWDGWQQVGGIIGVSVSMAFLYVLAIGNTVLLVRLGRRMRDIWRHAAESGAESASAPDDDDEVEAPRGGYILTLVSRFFRLVDRKYKIYVLGVIFGLGFDTSTEVALLGIAQIQALKGTSMWLILLFPLVFTAGMMLIDTTDSCLMAYAYLSAAKARAPFTRTFYQIVLTGLSVAFAFTIGTIQMLSLILATQDPKGRFWDGVQVVSDNYDAIGGSICGAFVVVGVCSIPVHSRLRARYERRRAASGFLLAQRDVFSDEPQQPERKEPAVNVQTSLAPL